MSGPLVYLIAGEPSGDRLGAGLIRALRARAPEIRVAGIGGQEMRAAGLDPLFGIEDLAVMGVAEVVPRLPAILRRMREATADVLARRPDMLLTVDAPSFSLRVAERVRRRAPEIRTVHYVAPTVWAWRPGRAKHMARFVDHVLTLLPFEPPYMEAAGMGATFVGHPVADLVRPSDAALAGFAARRGIGDGPRLLLAPGSRRGEVARHMPVLSGLLARAEIARRIGAFLVPVAETVAEPVRAWAATLPGEVHLIEPDAGEAEKRLAFAAADAAVAASGTVTLELAAVGTPHVLIYETSWLTAAVVRRLVTVDRAHLVNLVLDARVVPERLQDACTPAAVAEALGPLLAPGPEREAQRAAFEAVLRALGRGGPGASALAAEAVLRLLDRPAGARAC